VNVLVCQRRDGESGGSGWRGTGPRGSSRDRHYGSSAHPRVEELTPSLMAPRQMTRSVRFSSFSCRHGRHGCKLQYPYLSRIPHPLHSPKLTSSPSRFYRGNAWCRATTTFSRRFHSTSRLCCFSVGNMRVPESGSLGMAIPWM
jgi:hypothetical protein